MEPSSKRQRRTKVDAIVSGSAPSKKQNNNKIKKKASLIPINSQQCHHTFETNALDHCCETTSEAYAHVCSFPKVVAAAQRPPKPAKELKIWDPYYCNGSMKRIFQELGFTNIIHDNVDFYQLTQDGKMPEHDVLLTNPPNSEDHIENLLRFVVTHEIPNHRPSCLLLPNWVSRQKNYSPSFVEPLKKATGELLYLSPIEAYTYTMPTWLPSDHRPDHVGTNGKTTPYFSSWYLAVPNQTDSNNNIITTSNSGTSAKKGILERLDKVARKQRPVLWVVAKTVKGLKWKIQKVQQQTDHRSKEDQRGAGDQ